LPKFLISWIGVNGKLFAKGQDILYQYLIRARFGEKEANDGFPQAHHKWEQKFIKPKGLTTVDAKYKSYTAEEFLGIPTKK
jgi:hypothetical protein